MTRGSKLREAEEERARSSRCWAAGRRAKTSVVEKGDVLSGISEPLEPLVQGQACIINLFGRAWQGATHTTKASNVWVALGDDAETRKEHRSPFPSAPIEHYILSVLLIDSIDSHRSTASRGTRNRCKRRLLQSLYNQKRVVARLQHFRSPPSSALRTRPRQLSVPSLRPPSLLSIDSWTDSLHPRSSRFKIAPQLVYSPSNSFSLPSTSPSPLLPSPPPRTCNHQQQNGWYPFAPLFQTQLLCIQGTRRGEGGGRRGGRRTSEEKSGRRWEGEPSILQDEPRRTGRSGSYHED